MHNVCNICMPQAICDVISSISIGIGAAAADSIGYRAPARHRSNPNNHLCFEGPSSSQFPLPHL